MNTISQPDSSSDLGGVHHWNFSLQCSQMVLSGCESLLTFHTAGHHVGQICPALPASRADGAKIQPGSPRSPSMLRPDCCRRRATETNLCATWNGVTDGEPPSAGHSLHSMQVSLFRKTVKIIRPTVWDSLHIFLLSSNLRWFPWWAARVVCWNK